MRNDKYNESVVGNPDFAYAEKNGHRLAVE